MAGASKSGSERKPLSAGHLRVRARVRVRVGVGVGVRVRVRVKGL